MVLHFFKIRRRDVRTNKARAGRLALFACFIVVIASVGAFVSPRTAKAASLSNPSWWIGTCDTGRTGTYGAVAGTWNGLQACYPQNSSHQWINSQPNFNTPIPTQDGVSNTAWQCVELSERYLYLEYGLKALTADGSTVVDNYYRYYHSSQPLLTEGTAYANSNDSNYVYLSPGGSPTTSDVVSIIWYNGGVHTAVVTGSSINSSGNGTISLFQQNAFWSGPWVSGWLTVSNWKVLDVNNRGLKKFNWLHYTTPSVQSHFTPLGGLWLMHNGSTASGVGLYNPTSHTFYLKNAFPASGGAGVADETVSLGDNGDLPLVGDWMGGGLDTIGVYRPGNATFYLGSENLQGTPIIASFSYGDPNQGWLPIAGDWTGSGTDEVGLYDPSTSTFYLRNTLTSGVADETIKFGNPGDIPIVGNWYGTGQDVIGVYRPSNSTFYLASSNTPNTTAAYTIFYGNPGAGWLPIIGDWTDSGYDTIGLYNHTTATFYLRNSLSSGTADETFVYGDGN